MSGNIFKLWRCVLADIIYRFAGAQTTKKIDADAERYLMNSSNEDKHRKGLSALNYLLLSEDRTFRNVFYYRARGLGKLCTLCKLFLPAVKAVEIYGEIDGGLLLSHNHMVVHPEKAGKNLYVGPGAVIGKNNGGFPIIGDNVYVGANSTVIGNINIGDNVTILPGTVVTKSLRDNAIYSGNPARCVNDAQNTV